VRRFSIITLITNIAVVLWGAFVRATGAGAGCGNHWPLCNGVVVPREPVAETLIEFTHRVSSGIAFLMVLGLLILIRRRYPGKHPARSYAALAMVFMVIEALIGAGLVLFELVAYNTSVARAAVGALHLLNTFLLLGAIVAVIESVEPTNATIFRVVGTRSWLLVFGAIGFLLVGMSGAIAALGDTLFPSTSFLQGLAQDFNREAHFLIRLRIWHPLVAVLASILVVIGAYLPQPGRDGADRIKLVLLILIVIQLFAGVINVLLLGPIWLQILHLLLADLIWLTLIVYLFRSLPEHFDR
jgi:heme A synthase